MKTKISLGILILGLILMSFRSEIDKNWATVETQNGIGIFAFSKPNGKYEVLGMVKVKGFVSSEKGPHMVELLVESAKKAYPSCDAIIVNGDFLKSEVIKFKE